MIALCSHSARKKFGKDRKGNQRYRCLACGLTWTEAQPKPLGDMRVSLDDAKLALRLLVEGASIRSTERISGLHRDTVLKLLVHFGQACQRFMDERMRGLRLTHLQFDEQWTFVGRKENRLTVDQRREKSDLGDVYIWTCVDQKTKLLPAFLIGKRSGDNARRFLMDMAGRLVFPNAHASDDHGYQQGSFQPLIQISTDGFPAYPEAVDLAFGPYVRYGTIVKQYRNAKIIYTPSEMVGTKREGRRGISGRESRTICTSHVERLNGTQRLMLKRLNRLTYCFSRKLKNLQAAFALFAAYYNYVWQTRKADNSGKKRQSAAVMAGLTDHTWTFDELFDAVLTKV